MTTAMTTQSSGENLIPLASQLADGDASVKDPACCGLRASTLVTDVGETRDRAEQTDPIERYLQRATGGPASAAERTEAKAKADQLRTGTYVNIAVCVYDGRPATTYETTRIGNRTGLCDSCARSQDGAREHTDSETHLTYQAAAVVVANGVYDEALKEDDLAATLDDISDALAEMTPDDFKTMGTIGGLGEALLPAVAERIWAFNVIEHARADVGTDYRYVFDVMADALKRGADPKAIRDEVPRVVRRLRIERAILAAEHAITAAVTGSLAGLTTNPRDVAERLHQAIDEAQAEHLARVGHMSLERAESAEAFSTANSAMARALSLSVDTEGTGQGLRNALRMAIDEARAETA